MKLINKLIKHFEAKSTFHLFIIFVVFGISGSATLFLSEPIINLISYLNLIDNNILLLSIRIFLIFFYLPNYFNNNWIFIWRIFLFL